MSLWELYCYGYASGYAYGTKPKQMGELGRRPGLNPLHALAEVAKAMRFPALPRPHSFAVCSGLFRDMGPGTLLGLTAGGWHANALGVWSFQDVSRIV